MSHTAALFTRPASSLLALGFCLCLAACGGDGGGAAADAASAPEPAASQTVAANGAPAPTVLDWHYPPYTAPNDWPWRLPEGFPPPRVPADNPMTQAKVDLGRYLFYDPRLSGDGSMSCGSCHFQSLAFADGKARPRGITGQLHPRNSMALVNVAYDATLTWANPALPSLERQITNPVFGETPVEMGVNDSNVNTVLDRLRTARDVDYPVRFQAAFPEVTGERITWEYILKAISAFERTLISADSRFDRWQQGRDQLTAQEQRGWQLFQRAQCIQCHEAPGFAGQFVSAQTTALQVRYYNVGLYNLNGTGAYPSENVGALDITGNMADMGAYRAPTLRNIALTAPYMHDGSVATLEEAVDIMADGGRNVLTGPYAGDGRANPYKSELIRDQKLSAQDKRDLVAFLRTLTDEDFVRNPEFSNPFDKP